MLTKSNKMGLDLSINSTGICINDNGKLMYINIVPEVTRSQRRNEYEIAKNEKFRDVVGLKMIEYQKHDGDDDYNIFQIKSIISILIDDYNIKEVTLEAPALQASGRATATMAGLNYVIRQLLIEKGIIFKLVQPTTLKKWFTGNGRADKGLMVRCWRELEPMANELKAMKIDDFADSYALLKYGI